MEYKLLDVDSNEYTMNGELIPSSIRGSMARRTDSYTFKQELIVKSYLPGSVVVGSSRLESKDFVLVSQFSFTSDTDYDDYLNTLLLSLEKAVMLQDITNSKQAKIAVKSVSANHKEGIVKRGGSFSIKVILIDGFWTDLTLTTINQSLNSGVNNIAIDNQGYLPAFGKITLSVGGLAPQVDMFIDENKQGLQLIDDTLGQAELDVLAVDNKEGTLMIATFDRSQNIVDGTGYFPFPVGESTLVIDVPVSSTVVIEYYKRYYV